MVNSSGVKPYLMFGLCHSADCLKLLDVVSSRSMRDVEREMCNKLNVDKVEYRGYLHNGDETVLCMEVIDPKFED